MMNIFAHIIKRNGDKVPFNRNRIVNAIFRAAVESGERDRNCAEEMADQVITKLERDFSEDHVPHIEEIQDIVEYILIKNKHARVAKKYILYRDERRRKRDNDSKQDYRPSEKIPWAKCWLALDWAVSHELHTVDKVNAWIRAGNIEEIIRISEAAYNREIKSAAELITERSSELKLVIITGPSSSGKTTTTIKLESYLTGEGFKFRALNIDNYFFDLAMHPRDEFGDYDFETPQALDIALINEHLEKIVRGEEVMIPYYDFKTGTRKDKHTPFRIRPDEVLLLDSLHGLFPAMTEAIPDQHKFRLYLEPLLQLKAEDGRYVRWTDIRMLRRMLRDASFRAYNPRQTLEHWHYVRNSELRNIIPFIHTTDFIINTGMPYELAFYRPKLLNFFTQWIEDYREDPLRRDAFSRAFRVYELLQSLEPVNDDSLVPGDSLIREFIGGSTLKYH